MSDSDSTKKSTWESLAAVLGLKSSAPPPPPPPPPPAPVEPPPAEASAGSPSRGSLRSAPKASWQDLAANFGLPLPPPKAPPAPPPAPVQPARAEIQDLGDDDYSAKQAENPRREEFERSSRSVAEESVLLSPLAADSYKFEVIEETEIEFGAVRSGEPSRYEGDELRHREESPQEGREEGGQRRRRRRRRRRRGGEGDRTESRGRERSDAPSEDRSQTERAPQGYEDDLRDQTSHGAERTADEDFDEEEARARLEDLRQAQGGEVRGRYGAPRGDRGGRSDRAEQSESGDRPRRRRRGRRGGRRDEPQRSVPDGVAQGDEFDIMDEGSDSPISGDLPYGNGADYEEDADEASVESAPEHDDEHGEGFAEAGEGGEAIHRNIHTWEDTVGMLIAKNMESRARSPGNPQYSRGRGRNGRGRGRGRGRGNGGGRSQPN